MQRLADRIANVFVPTVIGISLVTLAVWLLSGASVERAMNAALSVLIIACPCALGLATPTALLVASGQGARLGIFFKGYQALEVSREIDTVLLDKTGTLTTGKMTVIDVATAGEFDERELLRNAGAVERASEHLVGRAITSRASSVIGELPDVESFSAIVGLGVRGLVDGVLVEVGRVGLFAQPVPAALAETCDRWERDGCTVVLVGVAGCVVGAVSLADQPRTSAAAAVAELKGLGLRCVLLTGDNEATARSIASSVGIDDVIAGALPSTKVETIRTLQSNGHAVAMVGDGVNDGPALATATLGLAVGSGTDVAINAAEIVIVRDDLRVIATAIELSRRTIKTIRGNLVWAFGYNVAAIPLAALGLLNPLIAAGAMALSSAFVVWNSSRLRHVGEPKQRTSKEPAGRT
jgi:heavy metal translocating P-type ATPase